MSPLATRPAATGRVPLGTRAPVEDDGSGGRGDWLVGGLLLAALLCLLVGVVAATGVLGSWGRPPEAAPAALALPAGSALPAPVELSVPAIDVEVPLQRLGTDLTGEVVPPDRPDEAGWVELSARPGRPGPAVLAGHVDTRSGPAVFERLWQLRPGDEVHVGMADGSRVSYVVRATEQHAKGAFPTEAVYGSSPVPTLRLVTCGGSVDPVTGHYRDNIVVYADLQG